MDEETAKMRKRSGEVVDDRPLVIFLYILLRDHLTAGKVEAIMAEHVEKTEGKSLLFYNGWVAKHAQDLAHRLTKCGSDGGYVCPCGFGSEDPEELVRHLATHDLVPDKEA